MNERELIIVLVMYAIVLVLAEFWRPVWSNRRRRIKMSQRLNAAKGIRKGNLVVLVTYAEDAEAGAPFEVCVRNMNQLLRNLEAGEIRNLISQVIEVVERADERLTGKESKTESPSREY